MSREWIKLHRKLRRHPKYLALTPAERSGYIAVLIEAEPYAGAFESEAQLREVLGSDYRYVTRIRAVKLMKGLKVHRYEQSIAPRDATATERSRRFRELKKPEMQRRDATTATKDAARDVQRLDETRRDETRRDESKSRAAAIADELPPMQNPSIEIQLVVDSAHERGWTVTSTDYAAIVRDFRRAGRLAQDYERVWRSTKSEIKNPWALIFSRADGKASNCTLVELATVHRLAQAEEAEHNGRKAKRDSGDKGGTGSVAEMLSQVVS